MKDQFVPYELAVKLKELGFKELCLGFFIKDRLSYPFLTNNETYLRAPLWQQAFEWFREMGFNGIIEHANTDQTKWSFKIGKKELSYLEYSSILNQKSFNTYEEAKEACLIKLIELI